MDVFIGDAESEVRPVDVQSMSGPEADERIVAAAVERLLEHEAATTRLQDDTTLWHSVRAGTGR